MNVLPEKAPPETPGAPDPTQAPPDTANGHDATTRGRIEAKERAAASEVIERRRERQRRYRQRRSAGVIMVPVKVNADVIDLLVEKGYLGQWDEADRDKVSEALSAMVLDNTRYE